MIKNYTYFFFLEENDSVFLLSWQIRALDKGMEL